MKLSSSAITKPGSPICLSECAKASSATTLASWTPSGFLARTLEEIQERNDAIDWWERGNPE